MSLTSNFHAPLPGMSALYYCISCKKSFRAVVPETKITDIFTKGHSIKKVKCPDCKKLCGLDPKIQY